MRWTLVGARGAVRDPSGVLKAAQAWAANRGAEVLLADARAVFGRRHVESAILHAERAQREGRMTAHSVAMESLLYLSGQRQVSHAIRVAGLREDTIATAVLAFGLDAVDELVASLGWTRDDTVLEPGGKSLASLGVSPSEEKTVSDTRREELALERVALVDVLK
ncbi:MAG TPA: KEOPS complex subunit Cgi121 [Thermoplasmata archaeon]|nr:KEOPS complex subunit Cgi121 [Thermoplasmata archaeon]